MATFGSASKFGPLDYDPGMGALDNFGPSPSGGGIPPFSSSTMSSIFGANDTWSAPVNPSTSGGGWGTSSPPLGSGTTTSGAGGGGGGGDIWSAPTLHGVGGLRNKISLTDLNHSSSSSPIGGAGSGNAATGFNGFNSGGRMGLGAIGQVSGIASVPSRSSPLASPVAATQGVGTGGEMERKASDQAEREEGQGRDDE